MSEGTGQLPQGTGQGDGPDQVHARYYTTRYSQHERRDEVWEHVLAYLSPYIDPEGTFLELGAGYCSVVNNVSAVRRVALDISPAVREHAAAGVEAVVRECDDLGFLDDASVSTVFASNLLEHMEMAGVVRTLGEVRRVLRPLGSLILVQPNFRLQPGAYFDDYTHRSIFTDRSLVDLLVAEGFSVRTVERRFLPLTMKSRLSWGSRLVPLYLRLPWRPLAGQMLVVVTR